VTSFAKVVSINQPKDCTAMKWTWLVKKAHEILRPGVERENLVEIDGLLKDRPTRPWTTFTAGETN
jgi:hypothetical protein